MSGISQFFAIIGTWLKFFAGKYTKLERELAVGYIRNYNYDLAINKEWEGTLGDGLQERATEGYLDPQVRKISKHLGEAGWHDPKLPSLPDY